MANRNRHMASGQFTDGSGNNAKTETPHARIARRHVRVLQDMNPTPENIMRAHEAQYQSTVTIPSGPFWQQT